MSFELLVEANSEWMRCELFVSQKLSRFILHKCRCATFLTTTKYLENTAIDAFPVCWLKSNFLAAGCIWLSTL